MRDPGTDQEVWAGVAADFESLRDHERMKELHENVAPFLLKVLTKLY